MSNSKVDISKYQNSWSFANKSGRLIWFITSQLLFKPFGLSIFKKWRVFVLRCFGARLHPTANVYSTAKIWAPWNLEMEEYSCIASDVDCYNTNKIIIGANSTVSQKSFLCASSHDITNSLNPLITAPIIIKDQAWVAADAYIGMGVTIGQGAVVGARACVYKDVDSWSIVGGNPAKFIKKRILIN